MMSLIYKNVLECKTIARCKVFYKTNVQEGKTTILSDVRVYLRYTLSIIIDKMRLTQPIPKLERATCLPYMVFANIFGIYDICSI